MKLAVILIPVLVSLSFPQKLELDVVDCRDMITSDDQPEIIQEVLYNDVKNNPRDYVCAYRPCDTYHSQGWIIIKKDKSWIYDWDKTDSTTVVWVSKYFESGEFGLVHSSWDKYGIRSDDMLDGKDAIQLRDLAVKAYTTPVKSCGAK